tara:strand:+ start:359 stop:721 length:363 start_codon:yes stop_codon:yes gene_type:complete
MRIIDYNTKDLKHKLYDLVARTNIELGLKTDGKTMASLTSILAEDLLIENRFNKMTIEQIQEAFRQGVRFGDFEPFLNIRTFYKWIIKHKQVINDATYQVRTMGKDPKEVPFYQSQKLLK